MKLINENEIMKRGAEVIFLVACDPSMNELCAT
jgi:hypothetical protein